VPPYSLNRLIGIRRVVAGRVPGERSAQAVFWLSPSTIIAQERRIRKQGLVAKLGGTSAAGVEFQIDSLDTGWSSGRMVLKDGVALELILAKPGENTFQSLRV
jgi:hypothetical protein